VPALDSLLRYIEQYGLPRSIYLDRHSTYKTTRYQTMNEQLLDEEALTQFGRAVQELGSKLIYAGSPQAKGRVENLFGTFQDRLVKEMRLLGICTIAEANVFLEEYLPRYNKRFNVVPRLKADVHWKRRDVKKLKSILCIKKELVLRKDSTVRYQNRVYVITERISNRAQRVQLQERLDGSICITYKGRYLQYKEVYPAVKVGENKVKVGKKKISWRQYNKKSKPSKSHTWRTYQKSEYMLDLNELFNEDPGAVSVEMAKMA